MSLHLKITTTFLSMLLFLTSAQAQRKTVRPKKTSAPAFDSVPFDTLKDKLPPYYFGHSLVDLIRPLAILKRRAVKSEFETTEDYQMRLSDIWSSRLTGSLNYDSLLAFLIGDDGEEQLTASYDADLGMMNVELKLAPHYDSESRSGDYYQVVWLEDSRRIGTYVGRNAFNRSVRVQVYRNSNYHVAMPGSALVRFSPSQSEKRLPYSPRFDGKLNFSIVMGAEEARRVKPKLRALVIGLLDEPPLGYELDRDTPTIDDPYDRYNHSYTISIIPQEIWIYDISTGIVYARATGAPAESAGKPRASSKPPDYNGTFSPREVTQKARILARPEPQYTPEAKKNQVSGVVILKAVFSSSGEVTNIRAVSSLPYGLTEKAIEAAKQIKFAPAMKDGRAVSQFVQIEYNFNLY